MQAADDAHTLMHLTAALWYLLRHTPTRNRLMAAVYTAAEEAEEATAAAAATTTTVASPRMNPEVGGATGGGGVGEGDAGESASDDGESEGSGGTRTQTQTDTAGETTMDEGNNTDGERLNRAADEEQRTAEAAAVSTGSPRSREINLNQARRGSKRLEKHCC